MYIAYVMTPMWDMDVGRTFHTEAEADEYSIERTGFQELDPDDDPYYYQKYDPPVVILFEAQNSDAMENGKYTRPTAIYQRGEKFVCRKAGS